MKLFIDVLHVVCRPNVCFVKIVSVSVMLLVKGINEPLSLLLPVHILTDLGEIRYARSVHADEKI